MSGCWDASGGLAEAQRDVKTLLVVAVALLDKDGRILLSKRPEGKKLAGLWEFPGGKVAKPQQRQCLPPWTPDQVRDDDTTLVIPAKVGIRGHRHQLRRPLWTPDQVRGDEKFALLS